MNFGHEWLSNLSVWWWPQVADHLWQSTIFALLIVAATFVLRHGAARGRHALWMLASVKFMIPMALVIAMAERVGVNLAHMVNNVMQPGDVVQGMAEPVTFISNSYQIAVAAPAAGHYEFYCALTIIWVAGCFLILLWATERRRRFAEALRLGRKVTSGREWEAFLSAKASLGITGDIDLVLSKQPTEPTVGWVWKPVVLLPESIGAHLSDSELEAIVLHELVHVQRRDNLIGNLQLVVLALLWFYPLVWFISRKLINEREQACDERVLQVGGIPEAYASSILKVVRFSFGWKVAGVSGAGNGSNLRRRVQNIMTSNNARRSTGWSRVFAGTLMGLAVALMIIAGVNTRAGALSDDSISIETQTVGRSLNPVGSNAVNPASPQKRDENAPEPPAPPTPAQVDPPATPATPQPLQPAPALQPAQPAPPSQPSQPGQPAEPTQPTPPPATPQPASVPTVPPSRPSPTSPPTPPAKPRQDDEKAGPIEVPKPIYPADAKKDKIEGTVSVEIVIGEDGGVISAKAVSGPDRLRDAAVDAAYKARFKQTKVKGKPAKVSGTLSYNFKLDDPDCELDTVLNLTRAEPDVRPFFDPRNHTKSLACFSVCSWIV